MASRATIRAAQGVTAQGARGMATLKQTEMRIKSTANISKITKAMQMVAAAKLKSAEKRLESSRPIMDMINEMSEKFGEVPSKKTTFVPLTTDRGLCGGVNINLCKKVANVMIPEDEANGSECAVVVAGDKGRSQFNRLNPDALKTTVSGVFGQVLPNFGQASVIAEQALDEEADKYSVVYNRYVSAMSQIPTRVNVLSGETLAALENSPLDNYELEKAQEELCANLSEFQLASAIFAGMVDNQCSEIASKMAAMDNASRNCDSLVEKLQIQYNKARQAKITTELIEIISGAESLKG